MVSVVSVVSVVSDKAPANVVTGATVSSPARASDVSLDANPASAPEHALDSFDALDTREMPRIPSETPEPALPLEEPWTRIPGNGAAPVLTPNARGVKTMPIF